MLTYDNLVAELEKAWEAFGLHEHALIESFIAATHDRTYKAELFPEHPEPLTEEQIPPWVEVSFTWSALHQLRSEGREIVPDPLDLNWTYMVYVRGMDERNDAELVRIFQRSVDMVFKRIFPIEAEDLEPLEVEVRRAYQGEGRNLRLAYIQLSSLNISDLSEQWNLRDGRALREMMRKELQLARGIIDALAEAFSPNGRGGYHTVDAA